MKNSKIVRLSGILAIIGALYFSLLWLESMAFDQLGDESVLFMIVPVMTLFLGAGVAGLYFRDRAGRLGAVGLATSFLGAILLSAGIALMAWFDSDAGWGVMSLGMLSHPLGLLLYGIPAFRRKSLPRWHATPLLMGLLAGPVTLAYEAIEEVVLEPWEQHADLGFVLWALAIGIGWVMLGIVLRTKSDEASAHPAAA
jgi:hypothetical protein